MMKGDKGPSTGIKGELMEASCKDFDETDSISGTKRDP